MYIFGLNIGHNATACLLKDGKILGCVSEERFSRIKNHSGIPFKSINYLLDSNKISMADIDLLVLDNYYSIDKDPYFGKRFLSDYTEKPFKKRILSNLGYKFPNLFKMYASLKKRFSNNDRHLSSLRLELSKSLNFPANKILLVDHHLAHAYSACFNIAKNEKTLVFTLDGEGSGAFATISIFDGKNLRTISRSPKSASLGYFYAITTIMLGMKPLEHEFKVMGLAPYAKAHNIEKVYPKLKNLFWIDKNLVFHSRFNMPFADHFFKKEFDFTRFDFIAGAVQKLTEELTCEWIKKSIKKTGIRNIALSGGVFMNVKANQAISELPEVEKMFVMPSCGDECNAIGCCFYGYKKYCDKTSSEFNPKPIEGLYLGPEYDEDYVKNLIREKSLGESYIIKKIKDINSEIAKLLAKGNIVARCTGRSEWGARALGNRSILANPSHPDTVRILNEAIKDRDFWMPFTPSILSTAAQKYFLNPKKIFAPYMIITFKSTPLAQKHLPAAMHPYDFTLRPQVVTKEYNSDYFDIISKFQKLTGIGGVLNTSFNLHGEPNVLTPEDALHTVENSSLKYLAMGDYLFEKLFK